MSERYTVEEVERILIREWHQDQCACREFDGIDMATCYSRTHPMFPGSMVEPGTWTVDAVLAALAAHRASQAHVVTTVGNDLDVLCDLVLADVHHDDRNDTVEDMCKRIIAAGFHRAPTPEPSDEWRQWDIDYDNAWQMRDWETVSLMQDERWGDDTTTPDPTTNGRKCLCHRWAANPCLACESDGYDTPVVVDGRDAYATPWPTPEPTVKPDRETVARLIQEMPNTPAWGRVYDMADAILALWPGRTERAVAEAAWEQGATDYAKYMVAEESYYNGGGVYLSPPDEPVNPHRAKGAGDE